MKDYYAVLGVTETAEDDVIAAAYRALAKKYHPDTGAHAGTASADKFQAIQEAFEVLGYPARRADYDSERKRRASFSEEPSAPSENKNGPKHKEGAAQSAPPSRATTNGVLLVSIAALVVAFLSLTLSGYLLFGKEALTESSSRSSPLDATASRMDASPSPQSNVDNKESLTPEEVVDATRKEDTSATNSSAINKQIESASPEKRQKEVYSRIVGEQEVVNSDATTEPRSAIAEEVGDTKYPQPQEYGKGNSMGAPVVIAPPVSKPTQ